MYLYYPTPSSVTESLLNLDFIKESDYILEPCAGQGHIIKEIRSRFECIITAVELYKDFEQNIVMSGANNVFIKNFLKFDLNQTFDKIVCNPPFKQTRDFIIKCYTLLKYNGRMAFLLRLSLLSGITRYKFFQKYRPTEIHLLSKRPIFNGNSVDSCGYAWVIFDNPITTEDTIFKWLAP